MGVCTTPQHQAKLHIDGLGPTVTRGECRETRMLSGIPHPVTRRWRAESCNPPPRATQHKVRVTLLRYHGPDRLLTLEDYCLDG